MGGTEIAEGRSLTLEERSPMCGEVGTVDTHTFLDPPIVQSDRGTTVHAEQLGLKRERGTGQAIGNRSEVKLTIRLKNGHALFLFFLCVCGFFFWFWFVSDIIV